MECEATEMRISTCKPETMILCQETGNCCFHVGGELLLQAEELKYLGVSQLVERSSSDQNVGGLIPDTEALICSRTYICVNG